MRKLEKVIAEVAGRDSFAAMVKFCRENEVRSIIPTYVHTGTEYGDFGHIEKSVGLYGQKLRQESSTELAELVILKNPELWWALNGRFLSVLNQRYGFYTPCLGCHLYTHLMRLPLAQEVGVDVIIGGERESHGEKIKLNQIPEALDAYQKVVKEAGLDLELPIRQLRSEQEIIKLVGEGWDAGEKQLKCVLSANYAGLDRDVDYSRQKVERFLDEFLIPVGRRLAHVLVTGENDYLELVKEVLEDRSQTPEARQNR